MTEGMLHREEIEEYIAEDDVEYIDEGSIKEAIGQLNVGVAELVVYNSLFHQNEENRRESLAAADYENSDYATE